MGGTKSDRIALFLEFLNNGTLEQKAAYNDDSPIGREVHKEFNKTLQAIVNGYSVHKAMLSSSNEECDHTAAEKADVIMKKAFDDICEYLIQFRQRVRSEVKSDITDIRDVNTNSTNRFLLKIRTHFNIPINSKKIFFFTSKGWWKTAWLVTFTSGWRFWKSQTWSIWVIRTQHCTSFDMR